MPSILVVKMLYMMIEKADVPIPNAVLYNASEIPLESPTASAEPALASAANARIMPITVPRRPTDVEIEAIVDVKR